MAFTSGPIFLSYVKCLERLFLTLLNKNKKSLLLLKKKGVFCPTWQTTNYRPFPVDQVRLPHH